MGFLDDFSLKQNEFSKGVRDFCGVICPWFFSVACTILSELSTLFLGGGGAEVEVFGIRIEEYKKQPELLGVPTTFG